MPVQCVVGAQWGDEGKGKIIDLLSKDADFVVRFQGGNNAGHTILVEGRQMILHLVPSGILHPEARCVIGNGVVVDPEVFFEEVDSLEKNGVTTLGRVHLSDRAHVILPLHREVDQFWEKDRTIGTTKRGIGPAYADKTKRWGLRLGDLYDLDQMASSVSILLAERDAAAGLEKEAQVDPGRIDEIVSVLRGYAERLDPYVCDTTKLLHEALASDARILLEGAQGAMLDVDFGTYPFVTSSNTVVGGACTGSGIPPRRIGSAMGVTKAYTTRVGEGPFPTELEGELAEKLRVAGNEYGATTGRPRRCGWFDSLAVQYAIALGGLDRMAITNLDVLSGFDEIKVAVAYQRGEERIAWYPSVRESLAGFEPVYQSFPGWSEDITGVRQFEHLPPNAVGYIGFLEETLGVKIEIVSVGPERDQVIMR